MSKGKPKLTYEELKTFLDNYESCSIAWKLLVSQKGIKPKEESHFIVECAFDATGFRKKR